MVKFESTGMEGDQANRADPPFNVREAHAPTNAKENDSERLSVMALPDVDDINSPESIADIMQLLSRKSLFPVQQAQKGQRKLTVQLKRIPGREPEIMFGLEQIELPESEVEQQAIFDAMTAQLVAQHQHFINAILPKLPRALTTGATTRTDETTGEKVEAELQEYTAVKLVKSKRPSGKIEYKLVSSSGRYSQYGVVAFPEKLKEWGLWDGIDVVNSTDERNLPDGITMYIDERGKYPVLVKVTGTQRRPF